MSIVEVEESELRAHQQVTGALNKLLANPKTRSKLLALQKEANPDLIIPELDAAAPVREEVTELSRQLAEFKKTMEDERSARVEAERVAGLRSDFEKGRSYLRDRGYTDEGITAVEKFMEENGVASHKVAAAAHERLYPPQEPIRSSGGNRFDLFDPNDRSAEHMKALFADPDNPMALDALVNETLRATRGR